MVEKVRHKNYYTLFLAVTTVVLLGVGLRNAELSGEFASLSVHGLSDDSLAGADTASGLNRSLGDDGLVGVDTSAVGLQVLLDDDLVGDATLAAVVGLGGDDGLVGVDTLAALGGFLGNNDLLGNDVLASAVSLLDVLLVVLLGGVLASTESFLDVLLAGELLALDDDLLGVLLGDDLFVVTVLAAALLVVVAVVVVTVLSLAHFFADDSLDGLVAVLADRNLLHGDLFEEVAVVLGKGNSLGDRSKSVGAWTIGAWAVTRGTSLHVVVIVVEWSEEGGKGDRRGDEGENQSDLLHL